MINMSLVSSYDSTLGLGELCLKLPVLCYMPAIPGNVTIMLQRKMYYAYIMLNYVKTFYL